MAVFPSHEFKFMLTVIALLILLSSVAGCKTKPEETAVFWVVAGTNRGESFFRNSLGGYDAHGQLVVKKQLPPYHISSIAQDSRGRLWLGQAWNDSDSSNLLLVWKNGQLVKEIPVGEQPESGLVEFNDAIIAGCTEAGMGFSLWATDIETLQSQEVVKVEKEQHSFLFLTTIAATEDFLVAAAIHDGLGNSNSSHTSIWWYDSEFTLAGSMYLGPDTAVWSMVPMEDGNILLLNNSGFVQKQPDLLVFDPRQGEIVKKIQGSGFSFRGVADAGKIYILDRIWSSTRINAKRCVTVLQGETTTAIPLPDGLGAEDIAVAEGIIYLAVWQRGSASGDGIYALAPKTGELTQIIEHQDASSILIPRQR
jgi:hypothetical protein